MEAKSAAPNSCVIIADLDGVVRYATFSACHLLGLTDYEAANHTVDEIAHKISANFSWTELYTEISSGQQVELESTFVSPVGYRGRLHLHAHPVYDLSKVLTSAVLLLEVLLKPSLTSLDKPTFDFAGKYATTSLTYERGRELFLEMDRIVRSEDLFRTRRFTVSALAQRLNTNTQYLSHVINHFCNEPFPNYINRLRIQWMAAEKLSDAPSNTPPLWREAGFGSYSAYYRALKQIRELVSVG